MPYSPPRIYRAHLAELEGCRLEVNCACGCKTSLSCSQLMKTLGQQRQLGEITNQAKMIMVDGKVQREGSIIHVIARQAHDITYMLKGLTGMDKTICRCFYRGRMNLKMARWVAIVVRLTFRPRVIFVKFSDQK